ncbi:DUF309 domain-containing protein [Limnochorda pilosa]|uniref:DUF309 domain-containing protein n=1 Tax=Limnochorda pilosa TaxID=1555112 RepID=A0A0K2SFL8_LIMPI|nr:DUF309 domain-containing protein [Limnochorda pilosa]BAS25896.1 hypothetical protein LIP_0037 [Limnochorda pilosa]
MYVEEYESFVQRFNEGRYHEAYEALQDLWQRNTTKRFYKGLIQVAGAYRHWEDGNLFGAASLFHSAAEILREFAPRHQGMEIEELLPQLEACLQVVLRKNEDRAGTYHLPAIRLKVEGLTEGRAEEAGS